MKILIVGSAKSYAIETTYLKYLEKIATVELYNSRDLFLTYYTKSILRKILHRLHLSPILFKINRELLKKIKLYQPDIVWVFKGMEIFPETLKTIKSSGIILVNYNADDPFEYSFRGSGNRHIKNSLMLYNHHFSYSKRIVSKFINELNISSSWLPFGFKFSTFPQNERMFTNVVCFIGNPDRNRANLIQYLADNNIKLHVYGDNWVNFINNHQNIKIYPKVATNDFIDTAQKYYCQINIFREQNINSHNMRTFEMPALGCVMFAPISDEHLTFFKSKTEAFFFANKQELVHQIKNFISLDEKVKYEIAKNAYKRSIHEDYSYEHRAKQVFDCFQTLLG